jgi:hypothetical protein
MAKEIYVKAASGLTMTIQLYNGTSALGSPFSATEAGTSGLYVADMPGGTAYGHYGIVAIAGGVSVAATDIYWDGNFEIPVGLSMLSGLDPNNPMNVTPTARNSGSLNLTITGDGVTTTTVTRV